MFLNVSVSIRQSKLHNLRAKEFWGEKSYEESSPNFGKENAVVLMGHRYCVSGGEIRL